MAKPTKKTIQKNKRQPAKGRLSASRAKNPARKTVPKKSSSKATVRNNSVAGTRTKKLSTKTTVRKRSAKREISLRLSKNTKIIITIQRTKVLKKRTTKPRRVARITLTPARLLINNTALFFGLAGMLYFGSQIIGAYTYQPQINRQPQQAEPARPKAEIKKQLPASRAVSLEIPAIDVSAKIIDVGKNADDTLDVPDNHHIVGAYNLAPTPGEIGPAILAGHVDNYMGPGVFWRLAELKIGEQIHVKREDGTTAKFKIVRIKEYSQDKFPTEEVYGNIDHAGLRLITCSGTFNIFSQRYTRNMVVFAELI